MFKLTEEILPPGDGDGLHVHPYDETMYLISGELAVTIGDQQLILKSGESYFVPRNMPHCCNNTGPGEARALMINTPATATFDGGRIPIYKRPVHKREQDTYLFFGCPTVVHLAGTETGNELSLLESVMAVDGDSGLHSHPGEDEWLYVLSGEVSLTIGDDRYTMKAGESRLIQGEVPHRVKNSSATITQVIHLYAPGTLDPFIRLAGIRVRSRDETGYVLPNQIGAILQLGEEYDFRMLVPPGM